MQATGSHVLEDADQVQDKPFLRGKLASLHAGRVYYERLLLQGRQEFGRIIHVEVVEDPALTDSDLQELSVVEEGSNTGANDLEQDVFPPDSWEDV